MCGLSPAPNRFKGDVHTMVGWVPYLEVKCVNCEVYLILSSIILVLYDIQSTNPNFFSLLGQTFLVFRRKDLYLVITQKLTFMKSGRFHMKSGGFHKISRFMWNPPTKLINQIFQEKLQFYGVLWEGYVMFSHEIRWDFMWNLLDFERPIARNGKPYVLFVGLRYMNWNFSDRQSENKNHQRQINHNILVYW